MTGNNQVMMHYQHLITKKDELEKEIASLEQILIANNTNMTNSLVDLQGFPRADIDVYTVRNTRSKIIHLSNDHANLLKEIEKCLIEIHAQAKLNGPGALATFEEIPFALVDGVAPDSPAFNAGFQRGDKIIKFGDVSKMDLLPSYVNGRIGIRTVVKVLRGDSVISLDLTPNNWAGRGLLGCHLSSEIVDSVKNESVVLGGSLVQSVKGIAEHASKAVESLAQEDDPPNELEERNTDMPLIEKLDLMAANTENYLDSLATNMTSKIGTFLSKAITIVPDSPEITLVSDRRSNLLLQLQKNSDTYATDYAFVEDEEVVQRFHDFSQKFSIQDQLKEINLLLEESVIVKDFFQRMVPDPLDNNTFWGRYFFKVSELDFQENARSMALKEALDNQDEVVWDDSDEDSPQNAELDGNKGPMDEENSEIIETSNGQEKDLKIVSADSPQIYAAEISEQEAAQGIKVNEQISTADINTDEPIEKSKDIESMKESDLVSHSGVSKEVKRSETETKEEAEEAHENDSKVVQGKGMNLFLNAGGSKSSPNSDGSFDIVRKESTQPLEVQTQDQIANNDDDWSGWDDDSPDSPMEK